MRIERVDEKTVKCFLSNEELDEYEIDYKDFIMRSEKAKEIVKEIMEQAEIEVGYRPPQFAFDLQIMMVPDQGMVLTFSEKDPMESLDNNQIMDYLKGMKEILQHAKDRLAENSKKQKEEQKTQPQEAVFAFATLHELIAYARAIPSTMRLKSSVYEADGTYYLLLEKGTASYKNYSKACIQAMEFGSLYSAEIDRMHYLEEHGSVLISEKALKKLRL